MTHSTRISLILLFIGIALGGGCMYLLHITVASNESTALPETTIELKKSGLTSRDAKPTTRETHLPSFRDYQSVKSLEDATLHYNSFARNLAIYSYVSGLSKEQITNELYATTSEGQELSHRVIAELQLALLEKLAIEDPPTTVEFLVELQDTRNDQAFMFMIQGLFADLASSDLESTISAANTLNVDAKRNAISGIFATLIGESLGTHLQIAKDLGDHTRGEDFYLASFATEHIADPRAVWNEVATLYKPSNTIHVKALSHIAQQWYEQVGLSVIEEILASSLSANSKPWYIQKIYERVMKDNPEQAFETAMKLPNNDRYNGIRTIIINSWAQSNPRAAYEAVSDLRHSGQREQLQRFAVSQWTRTEPRYVLENLEIFPPNIKQEATDDAIKVIARTSPKRAAELTLEHVHSPWNSSAVSYVMEEWVEQDVDGAINWVFDGPLHESISSEWVDELTSNLVYSNPRRAFDLAVRHRIPEGSGFGGMYEIGLELGVINQIARQNIDLAVELLPKVREGKTRLSAYKSIGDRHIDHGDSKKAFELGLLLPLSDQLEYFRSISSTWARVDPAGLLSTLKDFPTGEIRSSVASRMSSSWYRDNFTVDQLEVLQQYID